MPGAGLSEYEMEDLAELIRLGKNIDEDQFREKEVLELKATREQVLRLYDRYRKVSIIKTIDEEFETREYRND